MSETEVDDLAREEGEACGGIPVAAGVHQNEPPAGREKANGHLEECSHELLKTFLWNPLSEGRIGDDERQRLLWNSQIRDISEIRAFKTDFWRWA